MNLPVPFATVLVLCTVQWSMHRHKLSTSQQIYYAVWMGVKFLSAVIERQEPRVILSYIPNRRNKFLLAAAQYNKRENVQWIYIHTFAHTLVYTRTQTRTHAHAHTHTYTHTHTGLKSSLSKPPGLVQIEWRVEKSTICSSETRKCRCLFTKKSRKCWNLWGT